MYPAGRTAVRDSRSRRRRIVIRTVAVAAVATALAAGGLAPRMLEPAAASPTIGGPELDGELAFAQQQIAKAATRLATTAHPRATPGDFAGGQWQAVGRTDWRSGFFTGSEWLMYENFGDSGSWRSRAEARTADFTTEVTRAQDHDVGFKTLATYGNGHRLTNNDAFRAKIFAGAETLAARYLTAHGVTQSWGAVGTDDLPVIVDNMMNLELFYLAAELTDNIADRDRWLNMAVSHGLQTERNQIRDSTSQSVDGSTCHVYYYGLGVCRTHQGLTDSSTWSRGQAWTVYGFTMSHQYAKRYPQYAQQAATFLATAQRTADLYLRRLAEPKHGDKVPLHDLDAPAGSPKDSSAAAIAASALLDLSRIPEIDAAKRAGYRAAAETTLDDLRRVGVAAPYRDNSSAQDLSRESILLRATTTYRGPGHPANVDIERGLVYADYYFVEALLRLKDAYGASPRAPAFLTASTGSNGVTLSWRRTRGAARYTVKRASTAGGPYSPVATTTAATYVDGSAAQGTTYYYVVAATNEAGAVSPDSAAATAAAPPPPPPPGSCPCSIWPDGTAPITPAVAGTQPVELGTRFRSSVNGTITGIRFYKTSTNTGTHTGALWSTTGTLLASGTFTGETASGWQQLTFTNPVAITAGTTYVASYFTPTGRYSADQNYFTTARTNGPLTAPASGTSTLNGIYRYTSTPTSFPNSSYRASNYWVDVVLTTG